MADRWAAVQWMRDRLNIGEHPPGSNCNAITAACGLGCVPWCAESVSRAINASFGDESKWRVPGVACTYRWGTAYVPLLKQYFDKAGLYIVDRSSSGQPADVQPGDLILFDWPGSPLAHVGMARGASSDGPIPTIEGNTSDDLLEKWRDRSVVNGVCRVPFDVVVPGPPVPGPPPPPSPSVPGAPEWPGRFIHWPPLTSGDDVRQWQRQMASRKWGITVDGQYGSQSKGICTQFQAEKQLEQDGVVGPATWGATWTAPVT